MTLFEEPPKDPEQITVRLAIDLAIVLQHWPVLQRETNPDGTLKSAKSAYVRTKAPTEERTCRALAFLSRTRVEVAFNDVTPVTFSVSTGRGLNRPDWLIARESLTELKKLQKILFPKKDVAGETSSGDASSEGEEPHAREEG